MTRSSSPVDQSRKWSFAGALLGVLAYRWATLRAPSSLVVISNGLQGPMALLGLVFLACALWVWWTRPGSPWTSIFLVYGIGGGIHWGGALGAPSAELELTLFLIYLAVTALADAAILHLALIFPSDASLAPGWRLGLYAPTALALLLAMLPGLVERSSLLTLAGVLLLVVNLFTIIAGFTILHRLFTVDGDLRRRARLPLLTGGIFIGASLALLGAVGVLPGPPEAWNLALGLVPITFAIAIRGASHPTGLA